MATAVGRITSQPGWEFLGITAAIMFIGTFYFWVRGMGVENSRAKMLFAITTLVPATAFSMYLAMFFGFGSTTVTFLGTSHTIYWARYADWVFTTPLLLLDLSLLADVDRGTILGLIGADVFMILTGVIGTLTNVYSFRFVWWAISCIAEIYILYTLYTGMTARAMEMSESRQSTFLTLRNITMAVWFFYPVVWILGSEGAGVISLFTETAAIAVLDIIAKVVFGIILTRSRAIFEGEDVPEPSSAGASAEAAD